MAKVTDQFHVGCNYWASHAGTEMWRNWRADVVRQDLRQLSAGGLTTLRVFPLWSDFQPLEVLRAGHGQEREFRANGRPVLDAEGAEAAGIDPVMLERFASFADMAAECGLKLIVGLITGWMSGRFFAPAAVAHRNAITDPESVRWQVRFVREFVRRFRAHEAVLAWDLGNECNCMGLAASEHEAWLWTHAISSAIRAEDPHRQIVSGMHSLSAGGRGAWTIADQAELTDILTTHPYPLFTPGCDLDPIDSLRPALHAAAESCLYADLGGKPCLVEEIGTLGNEMADQETVANYVRMSLYSSWAHGHCGFLWWCGYDQSHLVSAPYEWCSVERELGLFRVDRTPKPVHDELQRFSAFIGSLPEKRLPARLIDGVCLLTRDQDHWRIAYNCFVLAKQAGLDIRFHHVDRPLPDSPLYFVPSYSGLGPIGRERLLELVSRVRQGATLYLSHHDGLLSSFNEVTGLEVRNRSRSGGSVTFTPPGAKAPLSLSRPVGQVLRTAGAEALCADEHGSPVFSRFSLGKGQVFYLAVPLELDAAHSPGFFGAGASEAWRIYEATATRARQSRATRGTPAVGVTEHPLADGSHLLVEINYTGEPQGVLRPGKPWRIARWLTPEKPQLAPHSAAVLQVSPSGTVPGMRRTRTRAT